MLDERLRQLSVLLAQWQGFRSRPRDEKHAMLPQNRKCLEEACALRLECIKGEMAEARRGVRDTDVHVELLTRLQKRQDNECRKILDVGSRVRLLFFLNLTREKKLSQISRFFLQ